MVAGVAASRRRSPRSALRVAAARGASGRGAGARRAASSCWPWPRCTSPGGWSTRRATFPKDMLVYTQTSPDMHRMVGELTTLSAMTTGGRELEIWYDDNDGTSWPMQWYLRDFPNRHLYGGTLAGRPTACRWCWSATRTEPRRAVPRGIHRPGIRAALVVAGRPCLPRLRYRPRDRPRPLGVEIVRPAARADSTSSPRSARACRTCSRRRDSRDSTAW